MPKRTRNIVLVASLFASLAVLALANALKADDCAECPKMASGGKPCDWTPPDDRPCESRGPDEDCDQYPFDSMNNNWGTFTSLLCEMVSPTVTTPNMACADENSCYFDPDTLSCKSVLDLHDSDATQDFYDTMTCPQE